jgi:hypothetical protein
MRANGPKRRRRTSLSPSLTDGVSTPTAGHLDVEIEVGSSSGSKDGSENGQQPPIGRDHSPCPGERVGRSGRCRRHVSVRDPGVEFCTGGVLGHVGRLPQQRCTRLPQRVTESPSSTTSSRSSGAATCRSPHRARARPPTSPALGRGVATARPRGDRPPSLAGFSSAGVGRRAGRVAGRRSRCRVVGRVACRGGGGWVGGRPSSPSSRHGRVWCGGSGSRGRRCRW